MKTLAALALLFIIHTSYFIISPRAQLLGITGANHPELHWQQIETEHFILVYHQGLDSIVHAAAPIAEEVYHVVTTNLQTPLPDKIRIYFSDNDEERNAFAFGEDYIFVWMRGILDDNLFSLRSSGTSKWLRTVITHEFTHIVIARATRTWTNFFLPALGGDVPRWFNEGMARYMEPDGWTNDLDIPLRVAAVSSKLHLGPEDFLSGTLMYEGGQSLVRYIAATYGDSTLAKILKHREQSIFPYNFALAVKAVTHHSLDEIYAEWHKVLNVYYNTQFGQKEDIEDIAHKIPTHLAIVGAARLVPDGKQIALLGKRTVESSAKLYIIENDTGAMINDDGTIESDTGSQPRLLTDESGIEPYLSWSPDGKYLLFSKIRFGDHGDLVYDLYRCNAVSGDLERISSDERLEYPDWSPDGSQIVAAQFHRAGSDLVLMNADGSGLRSLTHFQDVDVEVYSPRWSPDGKQIACSIFRKNGMRDIALVNVHSQEIRYLTNDSINDRYPVWSPSGDSIIFLSFQNGIPDLYAMPATGIAARSQLREVTDVASNILAWDWSKNKDSVLVTSFTARNSVDLFWIGANRTVVPTPDVPMAKKYTAWRSIRWPLVTRPADSLPLVNIIGSEYYNSLAHISPLFFAPIIGTDITPTGGGGAQFGALGILSDAMQKHVIEPFAWYGDASNKLSYGAEYQNSQLLPTITVGAQNVTEFQDVIQDIAYYEHDVIYNLGIDLALHDPNSLIDFHNIFIGGQWQNFQPWNPAQFASVDSLKRPIAAKMLELGAGYEYLSTLFQAGAVGELADRSLGSDLTRARLRAFLHKQFALDDNDDRQLAFILHGAADYGDELPQDFLGFYKYDAFEDGFNLATIHERDRLRGIRQYYYGNRLLSGTVELRGADEAFRTLLPILEPFRPQFVEFFDMGSTWYANAPTNNPTVPITSLSKTQWLKTAGVELRSDVGFDAAIEGGAGWELVKNSSADFFIRITELF